MGDDILKLLSQISPTSPFHDSANTKLLRMGLLLPDGTSNRDSIFILAQVYAGLFFESLCDFHNDMERSFQICADLAELGAEANYRELLLAICVQYDCLRINLPEPVWWIVGNDDLVQIYVSRFADCLSEFVRNKEEIRC